MKIGIFIIFSNRVMTLAEKQELRTRIQKLPATSLDRVVEILEKDNPSQKYSGSILNVDLSVLVLEAKYLLFSILELYHLPLISDFVVK